MEALSTEVVTLVLLGDAASVGLIDGESKRENEMEPVTAAVDLVALGALGY